MAACMSAFAFFLATHFVDDLLHENMRTGQHRIHLAWRNTHSTLVFHPMCATVPCPRSQRAGTLT